MRLIAAKRSELAERRAAGKITYAQAQLELNQQVTQAVTEEQRRNAANNAVTIQQNAVAAQQQANENVATLMLLQSMQANRPQTYNVDVCNVPGQVNTCIYR